jgi:hypothetical protein
MKTVFISPELGADEFAVMTANFRIVPQISLEGGCTEGGAVNS